MNGPADLPRASQKQGPGALTGGLRPLPPPLQPKAGRLPGGATAAWELIGCPARVTAACPAWSASCHLLTAVGRGGPGRPHLPSPSPRPSACGSSTAERAGQTPTVCCKKEPLTNVPTHCQVAKPPVHPSSWGLPAYLLIPGCTQVSKRDLFQGARCWHPGPAVTSSPPRLAQAKSPGFLGETDKQQHQDSGKQTGTLSVLEQLRILHRCHTM